MLDPKETLSEKFVKRGFWLFFFTFLIGPIGYLIKVIISRDLSVEEVGMVYGVISFVTLLSMYNDLGFTESMLYYLPKLIVQNDYPRAKYILSLILRVQVLTSLLIYITIFLLAPWLAEHYFQSEKIIEILRIAGWFFLGINILHISTALFQSAQDTKLQKLSELIRLLGTATGTILLFMTDTGTKERYMLVWIGGLVVGIIFASSMVYRKYYKPYFSKVLSQKDTLLRKEFLSYSLGTLLTGNIAVLLSQIDTQLVISLLGPEKAGYYSTYLSLIGIPFMFLSPIIGFLFPVISELSGRGEKQKIIFISQKFWLYFTIIGIWSGMFFFQFGEILAVLFFGEKFRPSGSILAYSAPFMVFNYLYQVGFQVLAGTGQVKKRASILFTTLVVNFVLNILFIQLFGVHGSALAVGISWIPLFFLTLRGIEMDLRFFREKTLYISIISAACAFFIAYFLLEHIHMTAFLHIILALLVYLCIFLLSNLPLMKEAYSIVRNLRKK